ncbi:MAG: outer membrane protein assembly factor BamD [Flavobacteriales bacterium]|nr:outer membrane protein assembly factor BamD [Flavobacteriales bacterium]
MKQFQLKYFILALMAVLSMYSCSEYNKVLKSTDIDYKYTKSVEYYQNKEYYKALPILEELIGLTRGSQRAEDVYYYYAMSQYGVKDYYMANYYLKSFTKTFSLSPRAEECLFLAAQCSYELSPAYSLDQADTKNAINEYQLFLDKYPASNLKDSANNQIARLNAKLETKAFENASIYEKTMRFKAASSALKEFLKDYPESKYKEEAMYLIVRSNYFFAEGSIEEKKLDRMRATSESYRTFAAAFPQSKWLNEAEDYFKKSEKQIEILSKK